MKTDNLPSEVRIQYENWKRSVWKTEAQELKAI